MELDAATSTGNTREEAATLLRPKPPTKVAESVRLWDVDPQKPLGVKKIRDQILNSELSLVDSNATDDLSLFLFLPIHVLACEKGMGKITRHDVIRMAAIFETDLCILLYSAITRIKKSHISNIKYSLFGKIRCNSLI